MKQKNILNVLSICLLGFFCSCEQEPFHTIGITASFVPTFGNESFTRVVGDTWSGSEIVGIAAFNAITGAQITTKYHRYTPNGMEGTRVQLIPATDEYPIYYPTNGDEVTFTAFAPYIELNNNTATYTLTEQTTANNVMERLDFIHNKGTTRYSQNSPIVALNFKHKLSRVVINLTRGGSYGNSIAATTAQLQGVYASADCNVLTGLVTPSTSTNFYAYRSVTADDEVTFQAIVAPQISTSTPSATNRVLTFTVNDAAYTVDIPQDWEEGKSYTYNFTLDARGITLAGSTVVNWGAGTVAWDGDYYLTLSENTVNLYQEAITKDLTINTNHRGTVAICVSGSPTSINSNADWLTASISGSKSPYTITYNVTANAGITRAGYIHITIESGLTAVVTIIQNSQPAPSINEVDGNTNCFMVAPGGKIKFSLCRPISLEYANNNSMFTIEKIWDDTPGGAVVDAYISGVGSDAFAIVAAGSTPGNALIAVKVGDAIVWSYHIWVSDYNPYAGATYTNVHSGHTFMDRNLGATFAGRGSGKGTGLFYQWGRKDPFPATGNPGDIQDGGGCFMTMSTLGTIDDAVINPSMFFCAIVDDDDDDLGDWLSIQDNTLWGYDSSKTVYDPCPVGWRVPIGNPWVGFTPDNATVSSNGFSWGTHAVYPLTGNMHPFNASRSSTSFGFASSASPLGVHSGVFICSSYIGYTTAYRAGGVPVRCVRDN